MNLNLEHLGYSGLRVTVGDTSVCVDPPSPVDGSVVVTWSERERVEGARGSSGPLAGAPEILSWLGRTGVALGEAEPVSLADVSIRSRMYRPIPYATAAEALRKTWCAVRSPAYATQRVLYTLGRPAAPPRALTLDLGGERVVLMQQALHRFVSEAELAEMVAWAGPAAVIVAGTDYDDEEATGRMLGAFDARVRVVADLTGQIRRRLGLPTRPLAVALAVAPSGTHALEPSGIVRPRRPR